MCTLIHPFISELDVPYCQVILPVCSGDIDAIAVVGNENKFTNTEWIRIRIASPYYLQNKLVGSLK